jgi:hypothetical protein
MRLEARDGAQGSEAALWLGKRVGGVHGVQRMWLICDGCVWALRGCRMVDFHCAACAEGNAAGGGGTVGACLPRRVLELAVWRAVDGVHLPIHPRRYFTRTHTESQRTVHRPRT